MRLPLTEKTLAEFQLILDQPQLTIPSATNARRIGQIQPRSVKFIIDVWYQKDEVHEIYFAVNRAVGPGSPVGYCGFLLAPGPVLYAVNAAVDPQYQKQGILSELMLFVKKYTKLPILSDTHLSPAGQQLWKSLIRSPFFTAKIIDLKTQIIFDFADIGSQLPDGTTAIDPEFDDADADFYDPATDTGQRFFYLLESPDKFQYVAEGREVSFGYRLSRHLPNSILSPMGHFTFGDM